jgi:hypothetical protein
MPDRRRSSAAARARARARAKHRALRRLRAELGVDAWPLDVAARNVVEIHWARWVGIELYRAYFRKRAPIVPGHRSTPRARFDCRGSR